MKTFVVPLVLSLLLSLLLSGCLAYHGPNHRDFDNDAFVYSKMKMEKLETRGLETKYELSIRTEYRYFGGKPAKEPSSREFELIKLHSPTAAEMGKQYNSPVSDYLQLDDFRFKGRFDFDAPTCTLRLDNKHKIKWLRNKKQHHVVTLVGRVDRQDPIRHTIYMAYTVKESSIPELLGQVFYGRALVCAFNEPDREKESES